MQQEVWKDTWENPENYEVSSLGRIRNKNTGTIRKLEKTKKGYLRLKMPGHKLPEDIMTVRRVPVHRIVANAFLGYHSYPQYEVDHINKNKSDNKVENLQWVSGKQNIKLEISRNSEEYQTANVVYEGHKAEFLEEDKGFYAFFYKGKFCFGSSNLQGIYSYFREESGSKIHYSKLIRCSNTGELLLGYKVNKLSSYEYLKENCLDSDSCYYRKDIVFNRNRYLYDRTNFYLENTYYLIREPFVKYPKILNKKDTLSALQEYAQSKNYSSNRASILANFLWGVKHGSTIEGEVFGVFVVDKFLYTCKDPKQFRI